MFVKRFTLKLGTPLYSLFQTPVFLTKFKRRGNNNWIWNQVEWKPNQHKSISFLRWWLEYMDTKQEFTSGGCFFLFEGGIPSHSTCLIGRPVYFVSAYFVATLTIAVKWWTGDLSITQRGSANRFRAASKSGTFPPTTLWAVVSLDTEIRMIYELVRIHIKFEVSTVVRSYVMLIYRVIHKSLRDFRTRLRNNQDRHGRKEHINR